MDPGREVPALAAQLLGRQVHGMFPVSRNARGGPCALVSADSAAVSEFY